MMEQLGGIRAGRLLILRARDTLLSTGDDSDFVELYKSSFQEISYREAPGDHYAHLTRARDCLPHILDFLSKIPS